jgi:hypothetical protein
LHPFLHRNTSNFQEQKFTTCWKGNEYFLAGHGVPNQNVLPALAYIEMARAAGEIAAQQPVQKIKTMVWANPMTAPLHANTVNICLYPHQDEVAFEVNADNPGDPAWIYVYAQGTLVYKKTGETEPHPVNPPLDIQAFKAQCTHSLTHPECYRWFQEIGLNYDPGFRAIAHLYAAPGKVLSYLELPRELKETAPGFALHPSLLEGVLQTTLFLYGHTAAMAGKKPKTLFYQPYTLEEVELVRPLPGSCYCIISTAGADISHGSGDQKTFSAQLLDEQGQELLKIQNIVINQALPGPVSKENKADQMNMIIQREAN